MQKTVAHYKWLLENTPFGGGACLLDPECILLWIYTSGDPASQRTKKVYTKNLYTQGPWIFATLIKDAFADMAAVATPQQGTSISGFSSTDTTDTADTADTINLNSQDILFCDLDCEEDNTHEYDLTIKDLPLIQPTFIQPVFIEPTDAPLIKKMPTRQDPIHVQNTRPMQRPKEACQTVILEASRLPTPEQDAHTHHIDMLIAQCSRRLSTLHKPASIQHIDNETIAVTIQDINAQPFTRYIPVRDFVQRATFIVAQIVREAAQRDKKTQKTRPDTL